MPELPEVETVRLGLNQLTCGISIVNAEVLLARTVAYPSVTQFQRGLRGTQIQTWARHGKFLLGALGRSPQSSHASCLDHSAGWLGVHLRMTGQLLWLTKAEPLSKHTRLRLQFENGKELRFNDQRTFGQLWWVPPQETPIAIISGLGKLGPEPLSVKFSPAYLEKILEKRDRPIKNALLDQTLIAGLGNIYVDESLFVGGIHPTRPCRSLTADEIAHLHRGIQTVIQSALAAGGTTFSDFRQVTGTNGNYGGVAWVYRRAGEPCRNCQQPIQRIRMAGRSCHFCASCQPA